MPPESVDTSVYDAFLEHLSLVPANTTTSSSEDPCDSCGEVPLQLEGSEICKSRDDSAIRDYQINDFRAAMASLRFRTLHIPHATKEYIFQSEAVRVWYEVGYFLHVNRFIYEGGPGNSLGYGRHMLERFTSAS
ncbi:hypothetical protein MPER_11227 [Moniliophthora perniciosa FA553]|nr:hypothetical protein MPER_11227 [Moniliophthora perniciosa FA553]